MPRLNPSKGMVMSTDIGGGKAVIEIKNPRTTITLELAEDSSWVPQFPEGAIVTYHFEVELPRGVVPVAGGPLPGDEIRTSQGVVKIEGEAPRLAVVSNEKPQNIAPDPEEIRQLHPIPGFNTVGINGNIGGESVRGLLGLPEYAPPPEGVIVANASPSSNA